MRSEIDPQALRDTALAALMAYVGVGLVVFIILRLAKLDLRTYQAPLTFGNTGNLGLPLAMFAFGAQGLDFAVVVFAVMAVLSFTLWVWVVSGAGSPSTAFKEPMVWATVLGGVFLINGWSLPVWATNTLDLIGQIAIPIMLATILLAFKLPPIYRSEAKVLIVRPAIPEDIVPSLITSYIDERIQEVTQRVMAADNVQSIIEEFDLYREYRQPGMEQDVIDMFRADTYQESIAAEIYDPRRGRMDGSTYAFVVGFQNSDPSIAQKVTSKFRIKCYWWASEY